MCANVQCSFSHKKQEDFSDKCHRNKLLGEGRILYVAARQKESKLGDIGSVDFQDKLFLIQFFHKVHEHWRCSLHALKVVSSSDNSLEIEEIKDL